MDIASLQETDSAEFFIVAFNDALVLKAYLPVSLNKQTTEEQQQEGSEENQEQASGGSGTKAATRGSTAFSSMALMRMQRSSKRKKNEVKTLNSALWSPRTEEQKEKYVSSRITKIESDGTTTILFTTDMMDQERGINLTLINETVLDVRLVLSETTLESSNFQPL